MPNALKVKPANYELWRKADLWTIERAILLMINAEGLPGKNYYSSGRCDSEEEQSVYDMFMEFWNIAQGSLTAGKLLKVGKGSPSLLSMVKPFEFIAWARSKDFRIPVELADIANSKSFETNSESQAQAVVNTAVADYTGKPWLTPNSKDPEPEQPWYVPARFFARQFVKEDPSLLGKKNLLATKVAKAMFDVNVKKRGGVDKLDPATVLKAFSKITFD